MSRTIAFILFILSSIFANSQDDLLSLLGEDEEQINYATASFKSTRVVNLHSIENVASGVLDFKIMHRFGFVNSGVSELFGLDQSTIRFGFDYGLSDRLMIGLGRSSFEKTYDGSFKYKVLRQRSGAKNTPFTLSLLGTAAVRTNDNINPDIVYPGGTRWFYTAQMIVGRKFSDNLTLQVSPTLVHRNLVATRAEKHDVKALGFAGRIKLSKRVALNAEYVYVMPDQIADQFENSFSLGFDIETGGHVFQLHLSNSTSMVNKGFIAETTGDWFDGDIRFGFNISRVFTIKERSH